MLIVFCSLNQYPAKCFAVARCVFFDYSIRRFLKCFESSDVRYIDSGDRKVDQALGTWFASEFVDDVIELRWQTGFFSLNGLAPFVKLLARFSAENLIVHAVIGSNEGETLARHVAELVGFIGIPRANAKLGIVSYGSSFFHPKCYHMVRQDGSQAAYVGSANLTASGVKSHHVEAGIILDTREGDDLNVLQEISDSIDKWFSDQRDGLTVVSNLEQLDALVEQGLLSPANVGRRKVAPPLARKENAKPKLSPLIKFASLEGRLGEGVVAEDVRHEEFEEVLDTDTVNIASQVLIAQIGKSGGRWQQANFTIKIVTEFFQVEPGSRAEISLHPISHDGSVGDVEISQIVSVKSKNHRFELKSLHGMEYPDSGRPIGVFLRVGIRNFRYQVLMPDDNAHQNLNLWLEDNFTGSSRHLKRVVTTLELLRTDIWPECPL